MKRPRARNNLVQVRPSRLESQDFARFARIGDEAGRTDGLLAMLPATPQPVMLASTLLQPGLLIGRAVIQKYPTYPRRYPGDHTYDTALPPDQRQRLGQSNRPSRYGNGKEVLDRAKDGIDIIGIGNDVIGVAMDPVGTAAGKVGFGIHDKIKSGYFDWLFDTASKISQALGGDPPRPDFDVIATLPELPAPSADSYGDIPADRAAALMSLEQALADLVARLRAAHVSLDRLGGATEAGDEEWIQRQAAALTAGWWGSWQVVQTSGSPSCSASATGWPTAPGSRPSSACSAPAAWQVRHPSGSPGEARQPASLPTPSCTWWQSRQATRLAPSP